MSETRENGKFEYKTTGGYDKTQVDSFINEVKKYIASQKNEKNLLTQKLQVLATKIKEYQQLEKTNGDFQSAVAALKVQQQAFEKEVETLNAKKEQLAGDVANQQEKLGALSKEREKLSLEVAELEKQRSALAEENAKMSAEIEDKTKVLDEQKIEMLRADLTELKEEIAAGCDRVVNKYLMEGAVVSDEDARAARTAAKEVLRFMTGDNEIESNTTKLMPQEVTKIEIGSTKTVDVVINAPQPQIEAEKEPVPEKQEEKAEVIEAIAEPVQDSEDTSGINWDSFKELESGNVENNEERSVSLNGPVKLTEEEAENLSYDDTLELLLKRNSVQKIINSAQAESPAPVEMKYSAMNADDFSETQTNLKIRENNANEENGNAKKGGFFSALKESINAILDDEDDEESDEEQPSVTGEETIRFEKK